MKVLILPIVALIMSFIAPFVAIRSAPAFGPIPKADQCISVNALINRNCAPVYMCNGPEGYERGLVLFHDAALADGGAEADALV